MSFISFAATCLQAKRLTRLGRKMTALVVLGAAALGSAVNADAGAMKIETLPVQSTWQADGTTEYEVQVRADSTDISTKYISSAEWHFTVPTALIDYLTFTRSSLPDPSHNPSQVPEDFFYGVLKSPFGFNFIDSSISNGELDYNGRLMAANVGAINRDLDHGLLGSYFFTVNPTAPQGTYNLGLHDVYIYDTNSVSYIWVNDEDGGFRCDAPTNNQFTITPEPATMALLGLGSGLIALSSRSRRRDEEKKAK